MTVVGAAVGHAAMAELLAGPNAVEQSAGLTTAVPAKTTLLALQVTGGVANVDLSADFLGSGTKASRTLRVAQVVDTLAQFRTVKSVQVSVAGSPVTGFGSGSGGLTPADFEAVTPQVLVQSVWPGEVITGPVPFRGTANTFEATVLWRVDLPDGTVAAHGFVQATSGSGTRGTFSAFLSLGSLHGAATLVFGGDNAKGGKRYSDQVEIPFVAQ